MKIAIFIIVIIFKICFQGSAQNTCDCPTLDNLKTTSRQLFNDGKLVALSNDLILLNSKLCNAKGYELQAYNFYKKSILDSAAVSISKALKIYEASKCAKNVYSLDALKLAAAIYENKADFEKSIESILKAMAIIENGNNMLDKVYGYIAVSYTFNRMNEYEKSMEYTRKVIPLLPNLKDDNEKIEILNRLAGRYIKYYETNKNANSLDSAFDFAKSAINLAALLNKNDGKINAWAKFAYIDNINGKYTASIKNIDSALNICDANLHKPQLAELYQIKAEALMNINSIIDSKRFADSALFYSKLLNDPPTIANAYKLLYQINSKSNNFKEALQALESEKKISDSLEIGKNSKVVNELEKKYNQAKNEKTIKELDAQKKIYAMLGFSALLIIGLLAFYKHQQSLKLKQKILETEQRLNRARMNPHFFFNALASLQNFAMNDKDSITMAENLSKFSHIMRETLENTYRDYVSIDQESCFLEEYLELQSIRFPNKFSYLIQSDQELEIDDLMIPSMILQPFVENCIEHGFSGINYKGELKINFTKENNEIKVIINDNGQGLLYSIKSKAEHISRASQIIKDRIYLLNIKLKTKARFSIDNNENNLGVNVVIHLPILYKEDIVEK